jgi:hypothetical protein
VTPADPPQTLEQAVERLLADLSAEDQEKLRLMGADDLIDLHLSLGMGMRNSYPIWGNEALLRSCAIARRSRVVAEMNKLLAAARGDGPAEHRMRKLFGVLLPAETVHPDDASDLIIRVAWERLRGQPAVEETANQTDFETMPISRKPWWQFWR